MKIHLLGVRGSTSAPGFDYVRYGGHTSCVAIPRDDGRWLVLDAGTGFRQMTRVLGDEPLRGTLLISHMHWDHTEGLPFLPNADRPGADVVMYVPDQLDGRTAVDVIAETMQPPSFPIRPEQLGGVWHFENLNPSTIDVEGFTVTAVDVSHKGGRTFGYRIVDETGVLVYVPDHCYGEATPEQMADIIELSRDADILLHDTQYRDDQHEIASAYAHSTIGESLELARLANVKHLVMFHHAPNRTDDELDAFAAEFAGPGSGVTWAAEGDVLSIG